MSESAAHPANSPQEEVEEIDRVGNVIRVISRREMRETAARHRAVFIAVLSSRDELLVHRRALTKDIWPGWWDVAVGGVMSPGETADVAASRELQEELGLAGLELESLATGGYEDKDVRLLSASYVCRHDGPFTFSDGEVLESEWVPLVGLLEWLGSHQVLPDSRALVLPFLPL
jgi:isopentenyldiphosphate isomerase